MRQLDLALAAGISARHLSFIETGRAVPSREAVLQLGAALGVPLCERNALLEAAGYASRFLETQLDAPEMSQIRRFLDFALSSAEPNPAVVIDRLFNVVQANAAMDRIVQIFAAPPERASPPLNLVRLMLHPGGLRSSIRNWEEVAPIVVGQLRRRALGPCVDDEAERLLEEVQGYTGVRAHLRGTDVNAPRLLLPIHLRRGTRELRLFSVITTVGSPQDVTLHELRIASFLPADEVSARALEQLPVPKSRTARAARPEPDRRD